MRQTLAHFAVLSKTCGILRIEAIYESLLTNCLLAIEINSLRRYLLVLINQMPTADQFEYIGLYGEQN